MQASQLMIEDSGDATQPLLPRPLVEGSPRGLDVPDLEEGLCNGAVEPPSSRDGLGNRGSGTELSSGQQGKIDVRPDRTILGLALYGISSLFLATVLMCAKLLGSRGYPVWEILLARGLILLALCLTGCVTSKVNPLGVRRRLLLVRGIFGFGAIGGFLWAVQLLPLNDAQVLSFTAPIWAALLSPLLLGERPSRFLAIVIALCMAGVTLITRPPFLGFDFTKHTSLLGVGFALGQALSSACAKMCVRELRTENPSVSVFYLSWVTAAAAAIAIVIQVALGKPVADAVPVPGTFLDWVLFLGVGFCSYGSQFCMTYSLRYAKAAPALAMSYLSIVVTLLYGYFIFHEVPTVLSLIGAALVICASLMLGLVERRNLLKAARAAEVEALPAPTETTDASQPLLQRSWSK